jgi:16S rRNA processing protein RimM
MDEPTIPVGYVRRAHGIRGDVGVRGLLSDALDRLVTGATLIVDDRGSGTTFLVTSHRHHRGDVVLHLEGVEDRNAAEQLIGTQFVAPASLRRDLEPGEWWAEELVGCSVESASGERVGVVADVITGAAQDRIVVTAEDGTTGEVPFVDALVPLVDTDARRVVVDLPDGLFS